MLLPLYDAETLLKECENYQDGFNAGLWYNKFCNTWKKGWQLGAQEKLEWINKLVIDREGQDQEIGVALRGDKGKPSSGSRRIGSDKFLAIQVDRLKQLVRATGGTCFYFKTETRFVTGLGLEHPVENGFLWHPVLGVPYIPGTAVKGLVRNWVEQWEEKNIDSEKIKTIKRIFGSATEKKEPPAVSSEPAPEPVSELSAEEKEAHEVGSVIFFDALPVKPVVLEADIMTPHYGPYYANPKDTSVAPGDWHSPTPIPFLTVAPEQEFLFAIAPRTPDAARDVELVSRWLTEALAWIGMGAKTALGYGRFQPNRD